MKEFKTLEDFENNFLDSVVNKMIKQQVKNIDNVVFDFLKANGYRPKRTEKYLIYLRKKLEKQGLTIALDKVNEQIDFDGATYSHKYCLVPRFEEIKKEKAKG